MRTLQYPESVPYLDASMICDWLTERDEAGQIVARNLIGWLDHTFGDTAAREEFRAAFVSVAGEGSFFDWAMAASDEMIAAQWNKSAAVLGYGLSRSCCIAVA